jgi:ribosome-associated toxin RatA of RatAB toxin-antitoxin module
MPTYKAESVIPVPVDIAFAVAKDVERFPEFMPDVKSVQILERRGDFVVSEWTAVVPEFGRTIRWVEEDSWSDNRKTCEFRCVRGDWQVYRGVWSFREDAGGARMTLDLEYDMNVPLVGPLIKGIISMLVEKNAKQMLEAIGARALDVARQEKQSQ